MIRFCSSFLPRHVPFCLVGAPGVGKTFLMRQFAARFSNAIHVDLSVPSDCAIFEKENDPGEILAALSFIKEKEIRGTGTLIVLDEIARCPAALRWFFDHTESAGSQTSPRTGHPLIVAVSSFLTHELTAALERHAQTVRIFCLPPLTFEEFLTETGDLPALEAFSQIPVPYYAYEKLLNYFHLYTLIGGMPEIVTRYLETRRFSGLKPIYESIESRFQENLRYLLKGKKSMELALTVMQNCYPFAASRIGFSHFGNLDQGSREIKRSFLALEQSFLLRLMYPLTETRLPIKPDKTKFPRLHMLDTGLVNYFSGIQRSLVNVTDMNALFEGQIARQVTAQELASTGLYRQDTGLQIKDGQGTNEISRTGDTLCRAPLFWTRTKAQSTASIDLVIPFEELLIPVIVRSGEPGRLRSLHQFVDAAPHGFAVRLSSGKPGITQCRTLRNKTYYLLNLPYFLAGKIPEHLSGFRKYVES